MGPRPRRAHWLLAATVAAFLLAGCTAAPRRDGVAPVDPAARRAALMAVDSWEARGRMALKAPGAGGQGSFTWQQAGDRTVLRVAGPFGSGAYEVRVEPARLTVLSARGEVAADYTGPDAAERFLTAQLGWSLPVANARYWLLGLAGPGSVATETADARGLPAGLVQDGWAVAWQDYVPEGAVELPRKLVLTAPDRRLRLVIDEWQLGRRDF